MADLHQFRTATEEPLDCIYILRCTGSDPLSDLELSAKEKKALRAKAKALGPRGEEGELISGEWKRGSSSRANVRSTWPTE